MIHSAVVNGSLGTIGLALVECLLKKGVKVYAVAFPEDPRIERIPQGAAVIPCDMREIKTLREKIADPVDAFFHLAWAGTIGPGRDDMLLQTQNIRCAIEATQTAADIGCQVFVGVGSQAEHGRIEGKVTADAPCFPSNGYGMAKLCAGQMTRVMCRQLGIRHEWARVLSVYGANDGPLSVVSILLDKLCRGEKRALTAGEQMWDYLYADDAAEALYCMAESGRDRISGRQRAGAPTARIFFAFAGCCRSQPAPGPGRTPISAESGDASGGGYQRIDQRHRIYAAHLL